MKVIFETSEQEKMSILEQHNLFKKALQSKVKRLMVNEQEQAQPTGGGREFLIAARDKGCKIAVGGKLMSSPGKPTILYKVADYDSANGYFKKGDELYIKDDFTFDVVTTDATGNKTLSASGKKWACPALTKPFEDQVKQNIQRTKDEANWKERKDITDTDENLNNPQMYEKKVVDGITLYRSKFGSGIMSGLTEPQKAAIKKWTDKGYKTKSELDPEELKIYKPYVVSPASEGLFSEDLIMYADPTIVVKDATITTNIQNAVRNKIPTDQKDCKNTIETYYLAFKKKRPLEPNEFEALKAKTQACKNEYYGDWGVLSGGKRMDNYLDIMSGGLGGPSRRGEDSKWILS